MGALHCLHDRRVWAWSLHCDAVLLPGHGVWEMGKIKAERFKVKRVKQLATTTLSLSDLGSFLESWIRARVWIDFGRWSTANQRK